ncbi:MAG: class I SAM-dependent RNA methyltransferase [Acidobacteriota bacterium]
MSAKRGRTPPGARLATADELEVTVEKLVAGGEGFARWDGVPLFVPRAAPGDRLRVRLTERRPDYGRAEIVEILEPGPGRRTPPCPHFARCGGCDLQHLDDDLQVRLKAAAVVETLTRIGKIPLHEIQPPDGLRIVAGDAWGYRLRTQLHTEPAPPESPGSAGAGPGGEGPADAAGRPRVGYFERGSHDLVPVDSCPILVPELEDLLPGLPRKLAGADRLPRRLDLAAGDGARISAAPVVEGLPHGEISIRVGEATYRFDARCFFQGHRGLLGDLVAAAVGGEGDPEGTAYDLYCGVGLFTLPLARRYRSVVAVEGDRLAARYARRNVRGAHLETVEVEGRAVESWIRSLPEGAARVVADPPRVGLKGVVLKTLLEREPRRITYVSCHPAALARDLRTLTRRYRLESLTLLDLFPQSGHMEAVAQLRIDRSL